MAWITKNTGTQQIDRRAEPYLNDSIRAELERDVLPRFPDKRAATIPALHAIQHHYNWIPFQAVEEIGEFLETSAAEVYDTATFYEEFFLQPKGRYLVQICQSIACEICGYTDLKTKLQNKLDIINEETTDDDKFTLQMVECLGACDDAPVVMINGKLYKKVTWEQLEHLLDTLPDDPNEFDNELEGLGL